MKKFKLFKIITPILITSLTLCGCDININTQAKDDNLSNANIENIVSNNNDQNTVTDNKDNKDNDDNSTQIDEGGNDTASNEANDANRNDEDTNDNNEGKISEDKYNAFLNGEENVVVSYLYAENLEFDKTYTIDSLISDFDSNIKENWDPLNINVKEVSYSFIDCGNDNDPELALKIEADDPDGYNAMTYYYIIKNFQNGLCLIDCYNTYYRSMGDLNKYGVFNQFGSGGASISYNSFRRINAQGDREFIYDCTTTLSMDRAVIDYYSLPSDVSIPDGYPEFSMEAGSIDRYAYSFIDSNDIAYDDDSSYDDYKRNIIYVFLENENDTEADAEYAAMYKEANINIVNLSSIDNILNERYKELGIGNKEMLFDENSLAKWTVYKNY